MSEIVERAAFLNKKRLQGCDKNLNTSEKRPRRNSDTELNYNLSQFDEFSNAPINAPNENIFESQ